MGYVIAKYIRLSVDDKFTDSLSIENQNLLLDNYILEMPEDDIKVIDFVDNGYSGTNLERPALAELIQKVQGHSINCIIVKDFSRFGRNVVDMGYYIEHVFPRYGVRFISTGDGYDSDRIKDGLPGIDVTLKFLINELYSKDLSQKIRAAKSYLAKSGKYITKNCTYGYIVDKSKKMVIDETAANVVRRIYELAIQGKSASEIATVLYYEKRLIPAIYYNSNKKHTDNEYLNYIWSTSTITRILRDEQYIGTYIAGKTKVIEVGSKKIKRKDESEWTKIPDFHPAIISKFEFYTVQAMAKEKNVSKTRNKGSAKNKQWDIPILNGKVVCACCKHTMKYVKGEQPTYDCKFTRPATDALCHGLIIYESAINKKVLELAHKKAERILQTLDTSDRSKKDDCAKTNVSSFEIDVQEIFDKRLHGEIDDEEYKSLMKKSSYLSKRKKIQSGICEEKHTSNTDPYLIAEKLLRASTLTKELAEMTIEKIFLSSDKSICVHWKIPMFNDMDIAV